jgi:hypothetical protein
VWYVEEIARVLEYLSLKSVVNYGILPLPRQPLVSAKYGEVRRHA